ncbi:MAG: hypothetical protein AAGG48_08595 [Planctomycetota bacterium]
MKRLLIVFSCLMLCASPAMAISEFGKQWKEKYLGGEDVDEDFKRAGRKAGCYVCHVKGEKKEVQNEYGIALKKYLKAKDFPREYVKAKPEEAKKKILEGFKKAGELESKDGKKFSEKLEKNELPATDSGL